MVYFFETFFYYLFDNQLCKKEQIELCDIFMTF